MSKFTLSKMSFTSLAALTVFMPVTACDLANNFTKMDRSTNSEFQDVRDAMAPREVDASASPQASDMPELQSYIADDVTKSKFMPLVSIAINQSIPIREALFELAKQANYDIELDPRITGSIIFTARNRPFDEVIDKISLISGIRYKIDENSMRVELDTPYTETYKVDYLSFVRTNESTINTDVSVASSGGAGVGGGSNFKINSKAESDFWMELDNNLKQILASNSSQNYLKTQDDPVLSLTSTAPSPVTPPVPPIDAAALGGVAPQAGNSSTTDFVSSPAEVVQTPSVGAPATTPASAVPTNGATPAVEVPLVNSAAPVVQPLGDSAQSVPPQQPVLKVESLPTGLASGSDSKNQVIFTPAYSINKQAGLVSVYGNERVQRKVGEYLEALRKSTTSQVLIEAKILEV
ncbi:MAG: secretin N-terminal domain-containing protein, partial [Pseudomonadota bacterium]